MCFNLKVFPRMNLLHSDKRFEKPKSYKLSKLTKWDIYLHLHIYIYTHTHTHWIDLSLLKINNRRIPPLQLIEIEGYQEKFRTKALCWWLLEHCKWELSHGPWTSLWGRGYTGNAVAMDATQGRQRETPYLPRLSTRLPSRTGKWGMHLKSLNEWPTTIQMKEIVGLVFFFFLVTIWMWGEAICCGRGAE